MPKMKWTVEIEVDETWVADGFVATDERALGWLERDLSFANAHEIAARVIGRPSDEEIAKAQGFQSVKDWRHYHGIEAA